MNRIFIRIASTALCLAAIGLAEDAHALGPVDLEAGAKLGVASSPYSNGPNPLGFGVGARAGLAFMGGIYAGANLMYYLGSSQDGGSVNTLMYGAELGYGLKLLNLLTIRPQVGLGNASFTASVNNISSSSSYWYLEPGVTGLVSLGLIYVGADANVLVFPSLSNSQAGFTFHAQAGVTF